MKKLLIILLFPLTSFSQDLVIKNGESKTITSTIVYQNITMEGDSKLFILDKVYATNLNLNGNNKIVVYSNGSLLLNSSVNLNSTDSLINNGAVRASAIEIQGLKSYIKNTGSIETFNSDIQLNHSSAVLENCGSILVKNFFNINSGKYKSCDCGVLKTTGLNNNVLNSVEGYGTIELSQGNINQNLTSSSNIYIITKGTINNPKWGSAQVNSTKVCSSNPLPVKIVSTKFTKKGDGIDCYIEFTQESTQIGFIVQESEDGITWKSVIYPVKTTKDSYKYLYHYKPE